MPLGDTNAGGPNPALLQLLFQRMEQRRQAEIDAGKQNFEAMAALAEERRKVQDHELKIAERRFKIAQERDKFLADLSGRADAAAESSSERIGQTASQIADQAIQGPAGPELPLPQGVQGPLQPAAGALSNESEMIRGQEFGPIARDIQRAGETLAPVFGTDPLTESQNVAEQVGVQSDVKSRARRLERETARQRFQDQKEIERRERRIQEADAAEREAMERGTWKNTEIDKKGKEFASRLSFVDQLDQDHRRLAKFDPKVAIDVFEMLQRWQRRVDQGATVRAEDINMLRLVGASGAESLLADATAFFDKDNRFPEGFGIALRDSFESMLATDDERVVEIADGIDEYAEAQGWDARQKARAVPFPRAIRKASDRIEKRVSNEMMREDAATRPVTEEEYNAAARILSIRRRQRVTEIPSQDVLNTVSELRRAKQGGG